MSGVSNELEMDGSSTVSPSDGGVRKQIALKLNPKVSSGSKRAQKRSVEAFMGDIPTRVNREGPEPLHLGQKLNWDYRDRCNLIGEKIQDPAIHICDDCDLPILHYGRMIPCKHVFCFDCATRSEKKCSRCEESVNRIEKAALGSVYLCTFGGSKHGRGGCRRTYLSKRDLDAHVSHRHKPRNKQPPAQHKPDVRPATVDVRPAVDVRPPVVTAHPPVVDVRPTMLEVRAPAVDVAHASLQAQPRPPLISTPPQQTAAAHSDPGLPDLKALVSGPPPNASSAMFAASVPLSVAPGLGSSHGGEQRSSNLITLTDSGAARPALPQMSAAIPFQSVAPPIVNNAFAVPPPGISPFPPQFHPSTAPAVFQQPPPSNPQFPAHAPPHQGPPPLAGPPPHQGPPLQAPHQGPPTRPSFY